LFFEIDSGGRRGYSSKLFKKRSRLNIRKYAFSNRTVEKWNSLTQDCINCTTINAFKWHIKNSWNRKQNKACVTLDSELYRRKPVFTYAISGNVVGGFVEFISCGRLSWLSISFLLHVKYTVSYHSNTTNVLSVWTTGFCNCQLFKQKHADSVIGIDGYTVFRRDRTGRRGGGVALYVQSDIQSSVWSPSPVSVDDCAFELLWVRVGDGLFFAALYHVPPRPVYATADLLYHVEHCVAELSHDYPLAEIILAGDLNKLQDDDNCRTHRSHTDRPPAYPRCQPTRPCIRIWPAAVQHCPGRAIGRQDRP